MICTVKTTEILRCCEASHTHSYVYKLIHLFLFALHACLPACLPRPQQRTFALATEPSTLWSLSATPRPASPVVQRMQKHVITCTLLFFFLADYSFFFVFLLTHTRFGRAVARILEQKGCSGRYSRVFQGQPAMEYMHWKDQL